MISEAMHRWLLGGVMAKCSRRAGARCLACVVKTRYSVKRLNDGNCFFLPALNCQERFQSSSDKKYHCSVCKKAFRLEMAAKLHLQQAHGGDGLVEAGPGPGVEDSSTVVPSTPPSSPIEKIFSEEEERRPRRMRPTPKPLHQPDRGVPDADMGELLVLWDKIGLDRLEGNFVHSTMVMKVFAARPDVSEQPLYEPVTPQGDNPFEKMGNVVASAASDAYVGDHGFTEVDLKAPFAPAPDRTLNPLRAGRVENPFVKVPTAQRETPKTAQPQQQQQQSVPKEEPVAAPITPFGQLPMFGRHQPQKEAAAAMPLQQSVSDPGEVASPFTSAVANSPFIGQVASPFTSTSDTTATPFESTPFTAASPFVVPGMQAGSPFSANVAPSPFLQDASAPPAAFPMTMGLPTLASDVQAEQSAPVEQKCPTCGKTFSTFDGLVMHSKAKHGTILEREKKKDGKQKRRSVPDLPAYIPSPVDLSSTSPFGTKTAVGASWVETELIPHAQCVSNITIVGRVLDVTQAMESVSHVTVFVQGEKSGEEETVTVYCSGDINAQVRDTVKRNATIFLTGTLRLHPIYEASNNKYYVSPVVHVASPTGTLAVIT
ncbi:RNA editing complex protein MP63 [Trypanosoma rangeli SC58]|uniref:RNA editing complex protein MP63 n=1 Tax=Trypanosoma rangeli SC58 TaxID=429131 RepID=A0A061J8U6_TRYRA|nr:RNA editing complex protein MP63 [Trypanosoma rangeli SC58]